jgi:hypothetical protein
MTTLLGAGREAAALAAATASPDYIPDEAWFGRTRESFGPERLDLSIGRLRIRLEGLSADQRESLDARFRPFVGDDQSEASACLRLRLTRADRDRFLALTPGTVEIYRMHRRSTEAARDWWSYEFAGRVRPGERTAELALVADAGPLFDRGLENFLRALTASFVLDEGGLLVHAATVVRDGKAYVFFGPSGAGKTTVTRLSARDTVLSDDMTLVLPGATGFEAVGIPFGMAHHHVPDTNASFPIAGLHRLVQSPAVERAPLKGAAALAELTTCLPYVCERPDEAARSLEIAGRLVREVPAWRLLFRKDESFWNVIQER